MKTLISNNITISEPTQDIIDWCKENLVVTNPIYKRLKIMGKEDTIRFKHIQPEINLYSQKYNHLVLPFGCLYGLWRKIQKGEYELKFNETPNLTTIKDEPTYPLYDYQEKAVKGILKSRGGVLVASCGGGKTRCGIELIHRIGKRALWICHTADLLRQARDDMLSVYPNMKIGLTTDGKLDIGEDVTISTVQTLVNIDPSLYANEFETVICDECAHVVSAPTQMKMFGKVLSNIPARYKIGLTATPQRSDGLIKAMYAYIGMSPFGKFEPTYKVKREEVKTMPSKHIRIDLNTGYNDFNMYEIYDTSGMIDYNRLVDSLSNNKKRNDIILNNIYENALLGRKQVVLALRVEHCEYLTEELKKRGVKAVLCVGKTKAKDREAILKEQIDWQVIVATYSLLKEGVSVKDLDTLHLTVPVKDKGMVVQCAGRVERYLEGKKEPLVFDYVDSDIPYCEKAYTTRRRALKTRF